MKRRTGSRILREITHGMAEAISSLTDAELRAVRRRIDSLSTTNCWWLEYHMRGALSQCVANEIQGRTHAHRSKAARARKAKP